MNTLVTGGAGFIGSHLVDRLLADGHHVVVLDNFSTGRIENLVEAQAHARFSLVRVDVVEEASLRPYLEGIDWVFHLAALADVVPSIERPLNYHRANVAGTVSVLEAARQANVKRFVYAASSSCYGIPHVYPTPESAEIHPQYPYALTKHLGEQCVLHWAEVYRLPAVSLRLFNVYGPRSRTSGAYGAVFGVFLAQKLHQRPLTVVGDGTQTRDFVFVSDVVEAFSLAAASKVTGEVFNVGSGQPHSVNRLVELLGREIVHVPKRPAEPERTHADVSKIEKILGWRPTVSFEEGVKIMVENIHYWSDAPVWAPESIAEATKQWFQHLSR
jgi:UDP-glucose 4-epimerase